MIEKNLKDLSELLSESKKYEKYLEKQRGYFSGEIRVAIERELEHQKALQGQYLKAMEDIQNVN